MKRMITLCAVAITASVMLTSCYTYTTVVGKGAQGTTAKSQWNHYVLFGLAPVDVSDAKEMSEGAADYTVTTEQSFLNGLISGLTFGLYSPTTTTVTK
jgi:predicted small secreted protein